ncbi:DNA-binding protein [Paraburkholderia elongata]|uniref:DNA-binding protein n=1 Tax=Paraburkholderia elongata TaxID=2675747 RepID=UPI001C131F35|nr:DNA-binding protein [Paraburkholderia elongata]
MTAGKPPTLAAVRKAVGGGSFTTIQDAMTEWKAKRQAKETPIKEPAPQALTDRLSEVGAEIWSMALQLANARLAADRETLEAERVQMEADRQEAADLADQLNEELDAMKARCVDLEGAERETAARLNAALAEAKEAAERATRAETRAAEIERRADDLNAELGRLHEQNAALIAAIKPRDGENAPQPARRK